MIQKYVGLLNHHFEVEQKLPDFSVLQVLSDIIRVTVGLSLRHILRPFQRIGWREKDGKGSPEIMEFSALYLHPGLEKKWYTHGILWVQVFIIFFHRNAPELPFNRWIFENVFVVDPVDVPIFGQDMARSANLSQSIACLRDRHVQLDNLWIFCELSVA